MNDEIKKLKDEQDIDSILDILHQVPQEEIPAGFDLRLREALIAEGKKIAERNAAAKQKKKKYMLRFAVSIAACFIVGFVSISMYNNGIGSMPQDSAYEESSISGAETYKSDESASLNGSERSDIAVSDKGQDEISAPEFGIAAAADDEGACLSGEINMNYGAAASEDGAEAYPERSLPQLQKEIAVEPDGSAAELSRHGSMLNSLSEDLIVYNNLVKQYLKDMEFVLISYTRDIITGDHIFNILIKKDAEGNAVNRPIILIGSEGEVYEQQQEEQQVDSD